MEREKGKDKKQEKLRKQRNNIKLKELTFLSGKLSEKV